MQKKLPIIGQITHKVSLHYGNTCDNAIKTRGHFEKLKIPAAVKACDGHDMSICCKKIIGTMVKHGLLKMY